MSTSRYAGLPTFADTINGRAVSIPELPDLPELASLRNSFKVAETPTEHDSFDAIADSAGDYYPENSPARGAATEAGWWVYYALNFDVAPDPLDVPEGVSLIIPDPSLVERVLEGGPVAEL